MERFIGPYTIAYCLALPPELAKLHNVFHVSMLRKYHFDESHILPVQDIQVQSDFTFDEEPKAILDRGIKQLRDKQISLVKVFLQHGRSHLGTRINNEGTIFTTFLFRYEFRGRNSFKGGGGGSCNTPNYTLVVYYMFRV